MGLELLLRLPFSSMDVDVQEHICLHYEPNATNISVHFGTCIMMEFLYGAGLGGK